jgi:aminoglycoside phosphotransferase family enzyme
MYGDIKLDNSITDCNKEIFLIDCMNYNGLVKQA